MHFFGAQLLEFYYILKRLQNDDLDIPLTNNNNKERKLMAYLARQTSLDEFGVVKIGNHIDVDQGVISIPQDVSPSANVQFSSVDAQTLTLDGESVITSVMASAGPGIAITDEVVSGPDASFKVSNTGVLSLVSGPGIALSNSTGHITVSATGADLISVYGTTTSYTATNDDEYIGVYSASAVTITLPIGVSGRVYTIKDEYGQGSGKITIAPQAGELIDGKINYVISVPHQSVSVVFRAGQWRII